MDNRIDISVRHLLDAYSSPTGSAVVRILKNVRKTDVDKQYDIIIKAEIEITGMFYGADAEEAKRGALDMLREAGELSNIVVERCVYVDGEDGLEQDGGNYGKGQTL